MASSPEHKELKANWKNEMNVKSYSKADVAKHKSKQDLWMIIHGKVYDVSDYAKDHPGGVDALLEVAGTDATSAYEDVGHSEDAREIMHAYLTGVLEGAQPEEPAQPKAAVPSGTQVVRRHTPKQPANQTKSGISPYSELAIFAVGTAGLALAANSLRIVPSIDLSSAQLSAMQPGGGSFAEGFILACVVVGAVSVGGFRYVSKATNFGPSFGSFAPHKPSEYQGRPAYHPAGVLTPNDYGKYKLRDKTELSEGIFRFVFELPTKYSVLGLPIGQHVAIRGTVDGQTVVRSYTPISNNRDLGRLELVIRVYPNGQLGNYLKGLNIGDDAEIRGPKGAMRYRKGMAKSIGMIGGGTGITPLFQIIRAICEDKSDNTEVSLIYGNRSESDIMLRDKIDHFAKVAGGKFKVYYTLDHPGPGWKGGTGYVTKDLLSERMAKPTPDTKILLCGPPPMVNATKKSLIDLGFEAPGAVSKMSDQVFCF